MKTRIYSSPLLTALPVLLTLAACSIEETEGLRNELPDSEATAPTSSEAEPPSESSASLDPPPPQAEGWSSLWMTSDYADTEIDAAGHFVISRNNCWVRGDGVMDVGPWNTLTPVLNRWIREERIITPSESDSSRPSTPLLCVTAGNGIRDLKGDLEFKKDGARSAPKFKLLSYQWEQGERRICANLPVEEKEALQSAVNALNQTLTKAFQEDCTISPR